ncbi:MAG TPA: DEAD/DEAH box helicase, partial [Planctomycetaceae bacterium]|nr:DEAD/DEAH box helicase [Planctomycetaceae bacterium]
DCLHEPLDIDGLRDILRGVERGEITFVARDTREPSPFALELLNANLYAFLDGGEIQERRARAVSTPRAVSLETVRDLGRLDAAAIAQVVQEAQPFVRDADELHDALLNRIVLPLDETLPEWKPFFEALAAEKRAAEIALPDASRTDGTHRRAWISAERLPAALAIFPNVSPVPPITAPATVRHDWTSVDARVAMVRGLLEICGPTTGFVVAERLSITPSQATAALEGLEGEGVVLRGRFTPQDEPAADSQPPLEWCHRRLLARIHRLTIDGLRKQIQPVDVRTFWRFVARHQGLVAGAKKTGANGLFDVIALMQGIDAPAVCWERDLLPARISGYQLQWLDELCLAGDVGWGRLFPPPQVADNSRPMASITRVAPVSLFLRSDLEWLVAGRPREPQIELLTSPARQVLELLTAQGAMFAADLVRQTQMLPAQMDEVLGELVSRGLVTADGFAGLRQLVHEQRRLTRSHLKRRRAGLVRRRNTVGGTGRWSRWRPETPALDPATTDNLAVQWAWQLLRRWGVVFRDLLVKEPGAPGWYELSQVYRRLEARGEIRGGRFVAGVGGEQFATADAVGQLRSLRDEEPRGELVVISAADPTNLVGILNDLPRIPSTASNRVAYFEGAPVAALKSREIVWLAEVPAPTAEAISAVFGHPIRSTAEVVSSESDSGSQSENAPHQPQEAVPRPRRAPRPPSGIPRPLIR